MSKYSVEIGSSWESGTCDISGSCNLLLNSVKDVILDIQQALGVVLGSGGCGLSLSEGSDLSNLGGLCVDQGGESSSLLLYLCDSSSSGVGLQTESSFSIGNRSISSV